MNDIVSNSTKFKKVEMQDSFLTSVRLEDRINNFLKKLTNKNIISEETYKHLYVSGSAPGILYGLAKIHKPNIPFRPILAAYRTAMYKLAKFLIPLIEPFTYNEFTVKNSSEFYKSIISLNSSNTTGFMVSYDINSLYTNVPVSETVNILCNNIFSSQQFFHGFDVESFKQLLQLTVSNTYFIFNKCLFKQLDGLAMGNPLAPALANVFLCNMEKLIFNTCPEHFKPKFYRRYLDDTFAIFDDEYQANQFFTFINNIHDNISFTMEKQNQYKLPFLDLHIDNSNQLFSSSVYRKPTFTGLATSFYSYCPIMFKINAIKTLLHRAYSVSSGYLNFTHEIAFLRLFFRNNGYPLFLFDNIVSKFLNSKYYSSPPVATASKQQIYISLPFFGAPSLTLSKNLTRILSKSYPQIDFKFTFQNNFTIASFFKYKDSLPAELCSSVIYKYSCGTCHGSYIGSTTKQARIRFYQHLSRSPRTNRPVTSQSHSSPRNHCETNNHPFSLSDFKIIDCTNYQNDLRILESLYIFKDKPSLNNDQSACPLFLF